MEINYKDLRSLFLSDPSLAVEYCHAIISTTTKIDTFQSFYTYHLSNSQKFSCLNEWMSPQMSIHCSTCGMQPNACICLQCFLNGNHQGHEYSISVNSRGSYDCGDFAQSIMGLKITAIQKNIWMKAFSNCSQTSHSWRHSKR